MIDNINNPDIKLRDRALLYICYYCGPTVKELQALRTSNIEANERNIVICFPDRKCIITDMEAKFVILRWNQKLLQHQNDISFLARIKKNNIPIDAPISAVSINKIIQNQFPQATLKTFREKLVCRFLENGKDENEIQDFLGFKSILALKKYKNMTFSFDFEN